MVLPWSRTRHESVPSHKTLLSLSPCFLTRIEPLVALYDSFMDLPWSRTRYESSPAHKTPLSPSPCFLTPTESLVALHDSWLPQFSSWLNSMSAGSLLLSLALCISSGGLFQAYYLAKQWGIGL